MTSGPASPHNVDTDFGVATLGWRAALAAVRSGESKSKTLAHAIEQDISLGALEEGARLPAQRVLAQVLGISVQTVTNAYRELELHGLIRSSVGFGSFVSRPVTEKVANSMLDRTDGELIDLSIARIIHTEAHDEAWREFCLTQGRDPDPLMLRACRPIAGLRRHREAGAEWLRRLGVAAHAENLLLSNGAAHGQFIALASVVRAGDTVLCDQLTDHGVIGAAQVLGFTLKWLDSDEHGLQPDAFEDYCADERITALVCTPNLNNPTSATLPETRRRAIARIAERYGVHVIEDDVFGSLPVQRPAPIVNHLPELGWYVTSFSKAVMTGLRVGYLRLPPDQHKRAQTVLRVSAWMVAPLLAELASRWVTEGTAARLVDVQRQRLASRHAVLRRLLAPHVLSREIHALSAWIAVPPHWTVDALFAELRKRQVAVTLPDPFLVQGAPRPRAIRICVGAQVDDARFGMAMQTIAEVFQDQP